jgi:hypothetical protein
VHHVRGARQPLLAATTDPRNPSAVEYRPIETLLVHRGKFAMVECVRIVRRLARIVPQRRRAHCRRRPRLVQDHWWAVASLNNVSFCVTANHRMFSTLDSRQAQRSRAA